MASLLTPTSTAMTLSQRGKYDAFPVAASHGSTVLSAWRAAVDHANDHSATIMGATSKDGGRTWGSPVMMFDDQSVTMATSPVGLAWDGVANRWIMLCLERFYKSATSNDIDHYSARLMQSTDGVNWSSLGGEIPLTGTSWWYAADLVIDGGRWYISGYGRLTSASAANSMPLTMVSSDAGKTWSAPIAPTGMPAGVSYAEPQLVKLGSSWLMLIRGDDIQIHQARSMDGINWTYDKVAVGGMTGEPAVARNADGTLIVLMRQIPQVDAVHGWWAWARSVDDAQTWTTFTTFPSVNKFMLYGALAPLADGSLACVFASEDDPSLLWQSCSIFACRFVIPTVTVDAVMPNGIPGFRVTAFDQIPAFRITNDPVTGDDIAEQVRVREIDRYTSTDYEVQQGQSVIYQAGEHATKTVTAPILPYSILVHPLDPVGLSARVDIQSDGDRTYDLDTQVTNIPSVDYAIVTKSGQRKRAQGSTVIVTRTLADADRIELLFRDGVPLFWSTHPGLGMPDWVQPLDLSSSRVAQMCSCHVGDTPSGVGNWREWTFKWVAVARPSAIGMPIRKRIRDYRNPIQELTAPIREL